MRPERVATVGVGRVVIVGDGPAVEVGVDDVTDDCMLGPLFSPLHPHNMATALVTTTGHCKILNVYLEQFISNTSLSAA